MTWVVGGKHLFCARSISDIEVTLRHPNKVEEYFDGVQKTHIIGPKLAISFADSIRLAFFIIEKLKKDFYPNLDERLFHQPDVLMAKLQKFIKYHYKKSRRSIREQVEFLVFIAPHGTYTEFGVYKLVSPYFIVTEPADAFDLMEIGSGSKVPEYRDIVKRHATPLIEVDRGPNQKPDGLIVAGKGLLQFLFAEAIEYKNAGISKSMQITLVTHDNISIHNLPENIDGSFPKVATSWRELQSMMRKRKVPIATAEAAAA
ncbi:hypothetical protein [Photobacterium damselae]|uniref:hypothetical protein n=1 Tax=Photobacterium damselae TaxID=38293 RepID=UPI001F3B44A5|nr:hypothetical protein [Photobacterium damselae]UKA28050.1 hypothetical protein IPQ37_08050 [Photobacterium damselae subsp. damselae]